ncbi:MAG: beta-lactamase family protein [Rhodothermales bacterium]|nr:beta-lactamase family protein [Rhodothermales bacterium]
MLRRSLLVGLLVNVLVICGCSESPADPDLGSDPTDPAGTVQAAVESFRTAHPHVLSAVGLIQQANGQLAEGFEGFLDESRTTAIGPDTRFSIGSITKTFTATMVLQLTEEGLVGLDEPLALYVSPAWSAVLDSIQYGQEVTVRQALGHRSGIYDYLISPLQAEILADPSRTYTPLEAFRHVKDGPPDFPPGTEFNYSNTNFLILGNVVENMTRQSYNEALRARILSPVGMVNTFMFDGSTASQRAGIAHSYATIGGGRFDVLDFSGAGWSLGVGGIISTAGDLVTFLRSLGSGQLFANSETLDMMTDLGENTWYGLGVQIDEQPFVGRCFGHGGYSFGSTANVRYCPATDVSFSAFYASDGVILGANLDILDRILSAEFD